MCPRLDGSKPSSPVHVIKKCSRTADFAVRPSDQNLEREIFYVGNGISWSISPLTFLIDGLFKASADSRQPLLFVFSLPFVVLYVMVVPKNKNKTNNRTKEPESPFLSQFPQQLFFFISNCEAKWGKMGLQGSWDSFLSLEHQASSTGLFGPRLFIL